VYSITRLDVCKGRVAGPVAPCMERHGCEVRPRLLSPWQQD
jgi:hypothetical protein